MNSNHDMIFMTIRKSRSLLIFSFFSLWPVTVALLYFFFSGRLFFVFLFLWDL